MDTHHTKILFAMYFNKCSGKIVNINKHETDNLIDMFITFFIIKISNMILIK